MPHGSLPSQSQEQDPVFALKTFDETLVRGLTRQRFEKELQANRNIPRHSRIVPVLAAFKHRRRCHLILPWADGGSLADIWTNYSPPHIPIPPHVDFPVSPHVEIPPSKPLQHPTWDCSDSWLLKECKGIAEALAATHNTGSVRQIHADIKPENILCFFSEDSRTLSLTLKLADFGEAVPLDHGAPIHTDMVPHTKTYRPPPSPDGLIGFNYDIWCLGCLFLDFITWFLKGRTAVEEFSDFRENEGDDPHEIEDIFFKGFKPTRIPKLRMRTGSKTVIKSGHHTRKSSLWIISSWIIEYSVKQSVREVSPQVPLAFSMQSSSTNEYFSS